MAVYVQKTWNPGADVIPDGISIQFSGVYLCVLNAEGVEIAKFKSKVIRDYWIETSSGPESDDFLNQRVLS